MLQSFGAVLLFSVSVFLSVRLTNPLKNMSASIAEIQNGYGTSDGELMIKDYSETVQISEKFNKLYSRMKMLDDSRQEFVSNVSHELKTPLTSMKVLADSLNGQEDVPVELYREFMLDIGNEIERENKIINDLLSLVKMDKSASDLNKMCIRDRNNLLGEGVGNLLEWNVADGFYDYPFVGTEVEWNETDYTL